MYVFTIETEDKSRYLVYYGHELFRDDQFSVEIDGKHFPILGFMPRTDMLPKETPTPELFVRSKGSYVCYNAVARDVPLEMSGEHQLRSKSIDSKIEILFRGDQLA